MRPCEICRTSQAEPIHRQHFLFPGQDAAAHYDVVVCDCCGFAFASDIPDQSTLNRLYQDAENHLHQELAPGLARIHDDFFAFVQQHANLTRSTRILDIGSGMGHFLSRFSRAGFHQLTGIEPSTVAARLGREVYDLEIRSETVDSFTPASPFGLITLCGVLEHIADLRASVSRINALLEAGGHLFVAVPDTTAFGVTPPKEAFLEFALEHINFFTPTSLDNLLRQSGFEKVHIESQYNDFYGNNYLLALYRKTSVANVDTVIAPDRLAKTSLRQYIENSHRRQLPVANIVAQLTDTGEPLIVWGAGSLTSRLLCDTRLGQANIVAVIDRNQALQGRQLLGFPIHGPEALNNYPGTTVLIASTTYASEIAEKLTGEFGWTGKILTLIDETH